MVGMLATSLAGHDKGIVYFILKEDDSFVYLTDGKLRTIDKPKKKKKKHIQLIKEIQTELVSLLESGKLRDEDVKRVVNMRCVKPV